MRQRCDLLIIIIHYDCIIIINIIIINDTEFLFIVTGELNLRPRCISAVLRHCLYINAGTSAYVQTQ